MAGYGAQLMGRLRSDSEELCEALEGISEEDAFLHPDPHYLNTHSVRQWSVADGIPSPSLVRA